MGLKLRQARTQTPGWGGENFFFESFGVYVGGKMRGVGGETQSWGGGAKPPKMGKKYLFLGKFSSWGGGEPPPSPPPCVRACNYGTICINPNYNFETYVCRHTFI